jgi:hypothetical protein
MFFALLIVTFALALAVSAGLVRLFSNPLERILQRIIVDPIHDAWLKYLKFAIYVVGVSSGVRIHDLERYISPSQYVKDAKILELNAERWVLEIYRTVIETLQGIAWLLLVFFVFALMAYVVVRVFEMRGSKAPTDSAR